MIKPGFIIAGCITMVLITVAVSNSLYAAEEYSLADLYKIALERSERIKLSEEDIYISERAKDKAASVFFPRLSTFGSITGYSEEKRSSTGSVIQPDYSASWGLRLDQSLSISGREFDAFKISKDNIEKSKYDLHVVREEYLFGVSFAYYDVLRVRKAVDIAKANVERLTKHKDAAAIRVRVGEVTKTVLLRAEAELSGAQSELIRAENNLSFTKAVLARVVGLTGDYNLKEASEDNQYLAGYKPEDALGLLKEAALLERVELKSLDIQKKIARDQVKYTSGLYWPTISIEGIYSGKDEDPATASFIKESIYAGIKLNFPFFEGGLRRAEVMESMAKQRQADLVYEDLRKKINVEVENAYLDYMTQKGVLKSLEDRLAFARDNYSAISRQFEFGLANSIDVMDANTLLVTAERQVVDAVYNCKLSILKLERVTGKLLKRVTGKQAAIDSKDAEKK
ncbi:MAG: TolC family protein [Thermodesulfobacteriota bacterium]